MEGNYLKRMQSLKKRAEHFAPFIYGTLLVNLFDKKDVNLPVVAMIFDMQELLIHKITDNCKHIWGYTQKEMEWTDIRNLIHPDDVEKSVELADETIIEKKEVTGYKNRHFDKAGNIVYLEWETVETFHMLSLVFCWKISRSDFEKSS